MKSYIKKLWIPVVVTVSMLLVIACGAVTAGGGTASGHDGIIRLHVIANSNKEYDQELKLKVRDGVLEEIDKNLLLETMTRHDEAGTKVTLTIDESRTYIENNLSEIEEIAEKVIRENGYGYTAKADFGVCFIPEKKYGGVIFPAGNYEALNIKIGEGAGENWWCVLFPPLCLIDSRQQGEDEITVDGGAITLKFKTLEILDSLNS